MNEVEQLALNIRRKAFQVLDGKESLTGFLDSLWQLDTQKPELFQEVAIQLEQDNDRWSSTSALPEVTVRRDKSGRIGLITFTSPENGGTEGSSKKDKPIVWCSNRPELASEF